MTGHEDRRTPAGAPPARTRLTVPIWLGMVLAAILIVVTGIAVVGARLLSQTAAESDDLVDRIQPAQVDAYRLQKALLDQETGVRGFVLSRDVRWLEPYTQGQREEESAERSLRQALAGDTALLAAVSRAAESAEAWRSGHAAPLVERARRGALPPSAETELQSSKAAFDRLRVRFDELNAELNDERAAGKAEIHRARTGHNWALAGMLAAFVAFASALVIVLQRAVGRPLDRLRTAAQRVADGDFEHRIEPAGPAETRHLAAAVEAMRARVLDALRASQQREELLAARTAVLDEQAVELRRSNAELEQFAYVASHDLQEPLRKVASFCQLLEKRYGDQLDERAGQYIGFAVDGAKRMQVLINDLLTYSRVGRLNDSRDTVSLDTALDGALANLGSAVEEAGAVVERPGGPHATTGDPMLLTMLWQNLIGNAVKFRAPDRPPVIRITVDRENDGEASVWHYRVEDNGIGIPEQFAEKVFVIFQRLHSRDAYGGTGIGLALCKKIVEHHGGHIWIDTEQPEGTRIHFTVPAVPAVPADSAVPAVPADSADSAVPAVPADPAGEAAVDGESSGRESSGPKSPPEEPGYPGTGRPAAGGTSLTTGDPV
ncbi:histidine kinase [Streptomyces spongiicola]|uniref:histidine kinase n=1 Tax=Streptomyces spongiicola TaxID=1690221 RepID=A0ABM6VD11_9ACTN|nr:sensor histidine kinase [Streptomyces spongiicola]AWK11941.1 histidine kinase [Streptomyces spongiicola]